MKAREVITAIGEAILYRRKEEKARKKYESHSYPYNWDDSQEYRDAEEAEARASNALEAYVSERIRRAMNGERV